MRYSVQIRWPFETEWRTLGKDRPAVFEDREKAVKTFLLHAGMARLAPAYQRVIDSDGNVIKFYDSEVWSMSEGREDGIFDHQPEGK